MAYAPFTKLARDLLDPNAVAAIHAAQWSGTLAMDARLVLARTPSIAQAPSPAFEPEITNDDFAAHLPPEEPARPSNTTSRIQEAREEDAANDRDEDTEESEESARAESALNVPFAPAVIRPQNAVVTFDLAALLAQAATPATPQPVAAPPEATAAVQASTATPNATQQPDASAKQGATDASALTALEAITGATALQGKTEIRPLKTLRAGRGDAASEGGPEFKAPANAGTATPPNVAGAAKVQTAMAVQPAAASAPPPDTAPATDSAPQLLSAAPAEHRAHRLNEAAGPAGHRPTTPAALVAQQIIRRFDGRSTSIDVRLDPVELGRVQVTLDVAADNKVTAVVSAENPATLADLMRSSRELERALQDAGLNLDSGDLTFDLSRREDSDTPRSGENASPEAARGGETTNTAAPAPRATRPFGLETWRGARVDVMV